MNAIPSNIDPRIGVLMRNGSAIFYAYHKGYGAAPVEGGLIEVHAALGINPTCDVDEDPSFRRQSVEPSHTAVRMRRYAVTISPSVILYSGPHTFGETVEYVDAHSRGDAEKQVRQQLREVNGRHGPKYNVAARLAD